MSDSISKLQELFQGKDWLYTIDYSESNRLTVYVEYMNLEVMTSVPEKVNDENVFLCFADYKRLVDHTPGYIDNLEGLVKQFGKNSVNDVLYEVHDGDNCITDYYNKNPQLFDEIEKLYNKLGFDVLFDLLDS